MRYVVVAALVAAGVVVQASPQAPAPADGLRFEVTSVKRRVGPGPSSVTAPPAQARTRGFTRANTSIIALMMFAFDVRSDQLSGGPDWIRSDRFDIDARAAEEVPIEQMRLMVRSLLEDRFRLATHVERQERPVYTLGLARSDGRLGPYLTRVDDCSRPNPNRESPPVPAGGVRGGGCGSIAQIASSASRFMEAEVTDRTGLTGLWDYSIYYSRQSVRLPGRASGLPVRPDADPDVPSYAIALQEQLGLELEAARGLVDVLVIDHVEPPTPD